MTDNAQRTAAKEFAEYWKDKGYEKGESQKFWLSLLRDVFGVTHPEKYIEFESKVSLAHQSYIDGYIGETKVLIEQKSIGVKIDEPIRQSDGSLLTPLEQAERYMTRIRYSQYPRWVIICNFQEFYVYDRERPAEPPDIIKLENLPKEYFRLGFLVNSLYEYHKHEIEVSKQAGTIVGLLYDELLKEYGENPSEDDLKSLNILCVRLVFCLYAEDAGIFGGKNKFNDYLKSYSAAQTRKALIALFTTLNTKTENRSKFKDPTDEFPYVNGGLFQDTNTEIPNFTEEMRDLLLNKASADFDWSQISPTIFGAIFESTLNPETRRGGGMHYTSLENIHKVIDPLFLSNLQKEFSDIKKERDYDKRKKRLYNFQNKISSITFFDPACGSGNFLTETYLSLRRLENSIFTEILQGQIKLGEKSEEFNPIKVSISQFYGIEINDFAVTVAKTALWIAESQMMKATEDIIHMSLEFLPLKTYAHITEGNALRLDWETIIPKNRLNYIMGNPPFVGYSNQSREQKADMLKIFDSVKSAGKLDYVCAWYKKAAEMMKLSQIKTAFVSTNSIIQGEQTAILWKPLFENGIHINFGVPTFKWESEATEKAAVHCVIVGFSYQNTEQDLNPYLLNAPTVFIESRTKPLFQVPKMTTGNRPADGGHLIIENYHYCDFINKEPQAKKYIKKLVGAEEYINNKPRYCLWLVEANPSELRKMPLVMERIEACRNDRLNAKDEGRKKLANTPTLFRETNNPETFIIVPRHSSETRRYVPMGFVNKEIIPSDAALIIPNAEIYHFGILTSNVHMAWMRVVCGRLKSDYRYSKDIVYNNFPWCEPNEKQKAKIEETAQAILDARAAYPESSLADLYGENMYLYPKLLTAHQNNDRAVMAAYDFPLKMSESECVAELMRLYQARVGGIISSALSE
ncbi:MAG: N-6 DNA methylase [Ruminococcus sp.]|jgi:type I restriction-modification system DNA methylase subunit|nr:N-6 DNA methylase [Ruminococcus sp.]